MFGYGRIHNNAPRHYSEIIQQHASEEKIIHTITHRHTSVQCPCPCSPHPLLSATHAQAEPPNERAVSAGKGGSVAIGALAPIAPNFILGSPPHGEHPLHCPSFPFPFGVGGRLGSDAYVGCLLSRKDGRPLRRPTTDLIIPRSHHPPHYAQTGAITGPSTGLERPAAGEGHRDSSGAGVELSGGGGSSRMYAPMQRVRFASCR